MDSAPPPRPARLALLDIGGVLCDVREDHARRRWAERGFDPSGFDHAFYGSGAKPDADRGLLDPAAMCARVAAALRLSGGAPLRPSGGAPLRPSGGAPLDLAALRDIWGPMVCWRPYVPSLLARLRVPFGLLSVIDPVHWEALAPLPLAPAVRCLSFETGLVKPAPEAFADAVSRSGLPAAEIRYVDDLDPNLEAALAAGLDARKATDLPSLEAALEGLLDP